jgi:hypothetical protein
MGPDAYKLVELSKVALIATLRRHLDDHKVHARVHPF